MYLKFSPLSHHLSSHLMDTFWPNMWCTESEAADATHWHRVDLTCDQWTEGRVMVAVCVSIQLRSVQSLSRVRLCNPINLQYARPPCPSPTPRVQPNPCPSSRWCHPTISSSVIPFSSRLQSFPASGTFPMSQFFASGGQSIGVSASTSALPMNTRTDLL